MQLKVCFRADASLLTGTGHVMRCLTLASALRERGHHCQFICREHPGNLIELIADEGFTVHRLSFGRKQDGELAHSNWLGASQVEDADACKTLMMAWQPDWLVVDHYALDHRWEKTVTTGAQRLLVIDDLADRHHTCDLLLDQNLGRLEEHYRLLVPEHCKLLIGPRYALLRPEFAALRKYSLSRRAPPELKSILISMGGGDPLNMSAKVLEALRCSRLPRGLNINVILGAQFPWAKDIKNIASSMPFKTEVAFNVSDMAKRLADTDAAIGAAGGSAWERCCLGIPTILTVIAENQRPGANALLHAGAILSLWDCGKDLSALDKKLSVENLKRTSERAASVTDGSGARVIAALMECEND